MKDALCKPRSLRVKRLTITPDLLLELLYVSPEGELCDRGKLTVEDGIPDRCRALRASLDHNGNISLLIESEKFDLIPEGATAPELMPRYSIECNPSVWLVIEKESRVVVCVCQDVESARKVRAKHHMEYVFERVSLHTNPELQTHPIRT